MSTAKVGINNVPEAMNYQKNLLVSQKDEQDSVDKFLKQAFGQDPIYSFSRYSDNPFQWIESLHRLDQQGISRTSEYSTLDNSSERKEDQSLVLNNTSSEIIGAKKPIHLLKDNRAAVNGATNTVGQLQPRKIPDAAVALAQAVAKANGETEKYLPGWPLFPPPKLELQKCTKCSREFCSSINYRRHSRVHRKPLKIEKDFPKNREHVGAFWDKLATDQAREILSLADMVVEDVNGSSILRALSTMVLKPGFNSLPIRYANAGNALLEIIQSKESWVPISSKELFNLLDDASEKTFLCTNTAACIQKFLFDGEAAKVAFELRNVVACASYMLEQKLVELWCADKAAEALRCQKLLVEEEEAAQKRQAQLVERKRMKKLRQKEQKLKEVYDEGAKVNSPKSVEESTVSSGSSNSAVTIDSDLVAQDGPISLSSADPLVSNIVNDIKLSMTAEDSDHTEQSDNNLDHEMHNGDDARHPTSSECHLIGLAKHVCKSSISAPIAASKQSALKRHANNYEGPNFTTLTDGSKTIALGIKSEIEENLEDKSDTRNGQWQVFHDNSKVLIGSINITLQDRNQYSQDSIFSMDCECEDELVGSLSSLSTANHLAVKLRAVDHDVNGHCITTNSDRFGRYKDSSLAQNGLQAPVLFSAKEAAAFLTQRWNEALQLIFPHEFEASDC